MSADLAALVVAVSQARRFLLDFDQKAIGSGLAALEERLRCGEESAIEHALAEATGGMGSLNDQYLYYRNGRLLAARDRDAANERLRTLVREIEEQACLAATAHGIPLTR